MSDGLKDALIAQAIAKLYRPEDLCNNFTDNGSIDDPWDLSDEYDTIDKIAEDFVKKTKQRDPFNWLNSACDCGSEKTYGKGSNVHSHWCSAKK